MLLKLLTVSPQPPSVFWCPMSQRKPASINESNRSCGAVCRCTSVSAMIAVAVDNADDESSPTQWPSGVRSASNAAFAF
jgi:hypothetical protein